jgi:hypothetical protein
VYRALGASTCLSIQPQAWHSQQQIGFVRASRPVDSAQRAPPLLAKPQGRHARYRPCIARHRKKWRCNAHHHMYIYTYMHIHILHICTGQAVLTSTACSLPSPISPQPIATVTARWGGAPKPMSNGLTSDALVGRAGGFVIWASNVL